MTLALAITSLVFHVLAVFPYVPWHNFWVITLPIAGALISTSSYLIGKTVSEPRKNLKLFAWFLGILATQLFVILRFYGASFNAAAFILLILSPVAMFLWCIVGMAHRKREECQANEEAESVSQTVKANYKKKSAVTANICIAVSVAIFIAMPYIYMGEIFNKKYDEDIIIHSPDGEYTLIIKEWETYEWCGTEIYGVKGSSPNWIEKLMPQKLGVLSTYFDIHPISNGDYEIEWTDKNIIIRYDPGGRDVERKILYLEYPDNTSIYLNFTALVVAIIAVITIVTVFIVKAVRKRKRKMAET